MLRRALALSVALGVFAGCEDTDTQSSDVVVRTKTEAEWAQYVANVEFAEAYEPTCLRELGSDRPRVLVTGFGRFLGNKENATGRMLSRFVPGLEYPLTSAPDQGQVDEAAPQLAVSQGVIDIDGLGEVEICGMVLPVFWDVASILVLREAASFEPDFVLMNGIAGGVQPIWLELGALNEAVSLPDGSGTLAPVESGSPLVLEASSDEKARGNLLSFPEVEFWAQERITSLAVEKDASEVPFGDVVTGVQLAGFPRSSNTYLCNNTTYTVGYVMDHPGETVRLLQPSDPREGGPTGIDVSLAQDMSSVPRVFVHWPSTLAGDHLDHGAAVMQEIIAAQIFAFDPPVRGNNAMADFTD